MTSVGHGNGGEPSAPIPNANSVPTGTLPSDREFSRSPSPESGDMMKGETLEELCAESTMQFGDTVPLDGAFETQILDTGGEIQLVDFGGETQVIDCEDGIGSVETQVLLDACDTQVAFDSHSEYSGGTEVLGSDDEISDGGSHGKGGYSRDEKKMSCSSLSKGRETREQSAALTDEPCSSGSVRRGFTSIRVASLRSSGLAAGSMYPNGASSASCSLLSTRQSSEEQTGEDNGTSFQGAYLKSGEEFGREYDGQTSIEITEEMEHRKKRKTGSCTVRRLFAEDVIDNMPDETTDTKEVPLGNDKLAGLSYVESQEPGDLSQANALDFVDRFLKDNVEQLHEELDFGKTVGRKPLSITSARGPQNLAKSASRITVRAEVFDWDDGREDEGGGDIFCRRKEDFFDGGSSKCRSVTLPRKHRNRKQDGNGDREEPSSAPCKTTGILHSDSEAILRMGGICQMMAKAAEMNHKRDLTSQLDEQSKIDSRDDLGAITGDACVPDMPSVGFDTQLAAEAMEELCQGEVLPRDGNCGISISTRKLRSTNRDYNEQSKKSAITLQKHSKDKKRCCSPGDKTRKLGMTSLTSNRSEKLNKLPTKHLQPKNRESLGRRQAGEFGEQDVTRTSNVGTLASKQKFLCKVGLFTPIASRTRSSSAVNRVQRTESLLFNHKKTIDGAENFGVCKRKRSNRDRRSSKKSEDDSMVKVKGNSLEQFLAVECGKRSVRQKRIKTDATSKGDLEVQLPARNFEAGPENGSSENTSFKLNRELLAERSNVTDAIGQSETEGDVGATSSTQNMEANAIDRTPREKSNVNSARTTLVSCSTPFNDASPVCVGNGYMNPSCKKNLMRSYLRIEIKSLNASGPGPSSAYKDMRKRRDMSDIRVLYSHHLDDDIVKQQKKILARLGASAVSSIAEATHFVTDGFVRTRNMLEAIASGKPVVTHLWLESCGQANCFLDERNYILRDAKKEKQLGFSMPVSLARACQHPLLLDRRVLITPNAKPGKDIISSLVKAVGGQPVERIGRSAVKDDKVSDDLLILSCEDDYDMCLPFLEKGAAVYSSELLLNGIVTQKLEYERHRLFADHVKRTRSTIWLKKDGSNFVPVAKHK